MARARGLPVQAFGIFILAASVGVAGGLLSVAFQQLLDLLQQWFMGASGPTATVARSLDTVQRVLVPAGGGLVAAILLLVVRNQRGPFGITDIIELVATRRGGIKPFTSLGQILSSACSIASGASIGKEGPNSQLAATVGAVLGRVFKRDSRTRSVLLGCGVAAGMACAYNAPIAGALFVMEVVLGNFAMDVFAPIVVASVGAILVQRAFVADAILFESKVSLTHPGLVVSAAVLGAVCGFGSVVFRRTLNLGARLFTLVKLPLLVTLPVAGLMVGCIGLWLPETWGNGRSVLEILIGVQTPTFAFVGSLMVMKIVATAVSTGSGALGGIFTPNLVVGAALGAFFADVVAVAVPGSGDHRIAFALVGMAGLCAATTHAPITAVILVFELTRDYGLILPLMLCAIIGSITARMLNRDSLYTARLRARGHDDSTGIEQLAMQRTFVRDLVRHDAVSVVDTASFDAVMDLFANARRDSVYVVDAAGLLLGHVHLHDVKFYINDPTLGSLVIAGDLSRPTPTVTLDESLAQILPRFDDPDLDEVAVVAGATDKRLLGTLTRRDVLTCLSDEVLQTQQLRAKVTQGSGGASYVELPPGCEIARIPVPGALHGRALDTIDFAALRLVPLFLIRAAEDGTETRVMADPAAVLEPDSSIVVLGARDQIAAFQSGHSEGDDDA